jgi:hypothetical protein
MRSHRVHRRALKPRLMPVFRLLAAVFVLGLLANPALAADKPQLACLTKTEQRAAVAGKKAVPLARVIKTLREHGQRAEVVRARLCHNGESMVYLLTLLGGSGKVTRVIVDAGNGQPVNGQSGEKAIAPPRH